MNKSESIKELAAAMAKAQPLIQGAKKDRNNPAFKSKYADLSSVTEAIDGAIPAHGLSYVQASHDRENAAAVETIILHASGEWLSCGIVSVPVSKHDAHGYGSALTYARRYSLSAAFGVVPEDDDGTAAAKAPPTTRALTGDEIASAQVKLEAAAAKGVAELHAAWGALPKEAKLALGDLKEKLKHRAADADAAAESRAAA